MPPNLDTPPNPAEILLWPEPRWRQLQSHRLLAHLAAARKSPLYPSLPSDLPAAPSAEDLLPLLPFTTKDQLAAAGPAACIAPPDQIREWVCTSGTLGKPLPVPLTAADLDRLAENEAVALSLAGLRPGDILLLAVAMDRLFVAGLAYWLGAQRLGATCLRAGGGGSLIAAAQSLLSQIPSTQQRLFAITVPSLLAPPAPPASPLNLTAIIAIGESLRAENLSPNLLAQRLHQRFHCPVLSTYASTETCTTFAEGPLCTGGHLNPRLAAVEIIDDATRPLPPGTPGEVVITPLGTQAVPLLRFRTGDIAALYTDPCPCGRTTPRLGPILGRRQQLLKLRGTSLYPAAIREALQTIESIHDSLIIADLDPLGQDHLQILVHLNPTHPPLTPETIAARLAAHLRVTPEVRCVPPAELARLRAATGSRKPQPFLDHRPSPAHPV